MSAPKNVPAPPAGTTASTHIPPEGARTGAAGPVPTIEPGRSTFTTADTDLFPHGPLGFCGHQVNWPDWYAGYRSCPRCEKRDELLRAELGHAGLSLVLPAAFAAALVLIAAVSGKLGYLWHHLPLTSAPNGFTLGCVAVLALFCWRRIVIRRRAHDYRLEVARDLGYNVTELPGPWLGTVAVEYPDPHGPLGFCATNRWDKRLATDADVTP
jgi:hypothetical protein